MKQRYWGGSSTVTEKIHRRSLLHYWSLRYFMILITGLVIVGGAILYFIHTQSVSGQKQDAEKMVRDIAVAMVASGGEMPDHSSADSWLAERLNPDERDKGSIVMILDRQGNMIGEFPANLPSVAQQARSKLQDMMNPAPSTFVIQSNEDLALYQAAVYPMTDPSWAGGYVLYLTPKTDAWGSMPELKIFIVLVFLLILIGWGAIYWMTQRMVKPIQQVADAAGQIVGGNYHVQFEKGHEEEEILELMQSFKEMAYRLNRLEDLRSQRLAGVTHELKTPVASISGLIQAVQGRVVTGEEADAFLEVCLKESHRLQTMIENLLDFNSFEDCTAAMEVEWCNLAELIAEIVGRWRLDQSQPDIQAVITTVDYAKGWGVWTNPVRVEQIMINLLNNASDAMLPEGIVSIHLIPAPGEYHIQVQDTGRGIPESEHADIFEPFYRGDNKKTRVRGLGIGLTFSRMIARSLGGDLVLSGSIPGCTTFTLMIPAGSYVASARSEWEEDVVRLSDR